MRDEMKRNIDAIQAFKRAFRRGRGNRYQFHVSPGDLLMRIDGVRINARLDASVLEEDRDGVTHCGACVLFVANTDAARRNIEDRRKSVAAMLYWMLEGGNIDPLPRLCMSFDVFGETVVKAPTSFDRWRSHTASACSEAAARWDRVKPPADYDGPDWR